MNIVSFAFDAYVIKELDILSMQPLFYFQGYNSSKYYIAAQGIIFMS